MSNITDKGKMPREPHFAIVTYDSVYHAADQRSIDHPGHGYPAYSESIVKYQAFSDAEEDDWREMIRDYTARSVGFTAMRVTPASVRTEVIVDVD